MNCGATIAFNGRRLDLSLAIRDPSPNCLRHCCRFADVDVAAGVHLTGELLQFLLSVLLTLEEELLALSCPRLAEIDDVADLLDRVATCQLSKSNSSGDFHRCLGSVRSTKNKNTRLQLTQLVVPETTTTAIAAILLDALPETLRG